MRRALIPLGLIALAGGLWFALCAAPRNAVVHVSAPVAVGRGTGEPPRLRASSELEARAPVAEAAAPAIAAEAAAERGTPRFLSSTGLNLRFVDWRAARGDWQRVELAEGGRPVQAPKAPCEVRAPGHLAAILAERSAQLVLEPDALLVLSAPELRECTRSIDVDDPFLSDSMLGTPEDNRRREVCTYGFLSESEWAVALSAEAVLRVMNQEELRIVLRWADERRADVLFDAVPGARGRWDVPCDAFVPGAPLNVAIERLPRERRGEVQVFVARLDSGPADASRQFYDWGEVLYYPADPFDEQRGLDPDRDELDFGFVPTGVPLALVAQDPVSKAYGRLLFEHDGSPRRLTLGQAFRVFGRLLDARDGAPLSRASLVWECRVGGERHWGWFAEAPSCDLSPDGSFELRGPRDPPVRRETPLDPPGSLWLRAESPGFEPLEVERAIGAARELDLGDLRLAPRAPDLVLAPGHSLSAASLEWSELQVAGQPSKDWNVRWGSLGLDGSMGIHIDDGELRDLRARGETGRPWSEPSGLVLYLPGDSSGPVRAFECAPDGRYRAVEQRRFELELQVDPSACDRNWRIGWEWRGLFAVCERVDRPPAGDPLRVSFSAPVEGARLAWVGVEPGARGYFEPTDLVRLGSVLPGLVLR